MISDFSIYFLRKLLLQGPEFSARADLRQSLLKAGVAALSCFRFPENSLLLLGCWFSPFQPSNTENTLAQARKHLFYLSSLSPFSSTESDENIFHETSSYFTSGAFSFASRLTTCSGKLQFYSENHVLHGFGHTMKNMVMVFVYQWLQTYVSIYHH